MNTKLTGKKDQTSELSAASLLDHTHHLIQRNSKILLRDILFDLFPEKIYQVSEIPTAVIAELVLLLIYNNSLNTDQLSQLSVHSDPLNSEIILDAINNINWDENTVNKVLGQIKTNIPYIFENLLQTYIKTEKGFGLMHIENFIQRVSALMEGVLSSIELFMRRYRLDIKRPELFKAISTQLVAQRNLYYSGVLSTRTKEGRTFVDLKMKDIENTLVVSYENYSLIFPILNSFASALSENVSTDDLMKTVDDLISAIVDYINIINLKKSLKAIVLDEIVEDEITMIMTEIKKVIYRIEYQITYRSESKATDRSLKLRLRVLFWRIAERLKEFYPDHYLVINDTQREVIDKLSQIS